jgi:hypothetical protein
MAYTNLIVYTIPQHEMASSMSVLCPAKHILWRKWGIEAWPRRISGDDSEDRELVM